MCIAHLRSTEEKTSLVSLMIGRQIVEVEYAHLEQSVVGTKAQVRYRHTANDLDGGLN